VGIQPGGQQERIGDHPQQGSSHPAQPYQQHPRAQRRQQRQQRVHPCLLTIVNQHGTESGQQAGDGCRWTTGYRRQTTKGTRHLRIVVCGLSSVVCRPPPNRHHHCHHQHPCKRRQRPQAKLRLPQQLAPAAQGQIVERRMDVAGRTFNDGRDRALAETGTIALVVPEGLRFQQVEAGEGSQQQHEHGRRRQSPGVAHRPSRGARARKRLKSSTAAPKVNSPGRARIQSYCQPGMSDRSGSAVAYSATAS